MGGIRTYIHYIYRHELFRLYRYNLLTPAHNLGEYFKGVFGEKDFEYTESQADGKGFVALITSQIRRFKPDVIHSHGLTAGLLTSPIAWVFRVPHIVTTHDVFLPGQFDGSKGAIKHKLIELLLRLPNIINPCGFDAGDNLQQYFPKLPAANIKPIRNGIDVKGFSEENIRDLHSELKQSSEVFLVGFFGRFMKQKGFDLLVKAIELWRQQQPEKPIHVACFGWGAFIREEQANITALGLDSYFSFMPHTDDMPAALRGVDAAIMPSRWEACPLLPMEAMVSGAVVLASDCIGMKEVCVDSPAIVFQQENVDDLYQKLQQLSENRERYKQAAQAFKAEAKLRFDSCATAESLNRLYQELLRK